MAAVETKIVGHPTLRRIPECLFPLQTDAGLAEYRRLARMLYDRDRLTTVTHRELSQYCAIFDLIQAGKATPRASWFTNMRTLLRSLDLEDSDEPVATPKVSQDNRFAINGFSCRG